MHLLVTKVGVQDSVKSFKNLIEKKLEQNVAMESITSLFQRVMLKIFKVVCAFLLVTNFINVFFNDNYF